jgi:hypothetical protein
MMIDLKHFSEFLNNMTFHESRNLVGAGAKAKSMLAEEVLSRYRMPMNGDNGRAGAIMQ